MRPFNYILPSDVKSAIKGVRSNPKGRFLAGGTNLLDLMKEDVEQPNEIYAISGLSMKGIHTIESGPNAGGVVIGALDTNSDTANHPLIRKRYPLLSRAILAGASAQIRNMATNGGNLLQRTRCTYFYDVSMPCNKRAPGTGCGALEGINRMHAVLGWSEHCVAVFPSDMAVALAALDAVICVQRAQGEQHQIPILDFHRLPEDQPEKDNNLMHGDLITAIELPPNNLPNHAHYLKIRDRASYAFALVSVAASLSVENNQIIEAKIALGGVAHKPWRAKEAEELLTGKMPAEALFQAAADLAMKDAKTLKHNHFKVNMGKRAIVHTLQQAMQVSPNT